MINFNKYLEEVNEGKIVLKRKYTENHPEKNVRQVAAIRNSIIEALRDKKLTLSEFNEIVAKHSKSPNKWTQRNKRFFKIEEDNVTLSKYGTKILSSLEPINEGKTHADYGLSDEFDYALADLSDKKFNTKDITALAKKYKQDPKKAIAYASTAFEWLWKESVDEKVEPGKYSGLYYDTAEKLFKRERIKVGWALIGKWLQKAHDKGYLEYTAEYVRDAEKDIRAAIDKIGKKNMKMFAYESLEVHEGSFDKAISKSKYDYDDVPSSLDLPDDESNLDEPAEMKNIKKFQKKYGTKIKVTTDNKVIGKRVTVYMEPGVEDGPDEVIEPQLKRHEEMMDFVKKHDLKISIANTVKGEWVFWTRYGVDESVKIMESFDTPWENMPPIEFHRALDLLDLEEFTPKNIKKLSDKFNVNYKDAISYIEHVFVIKVADNPEIAESVVNEAIAIEGKRDAKKVVTQLTRIFKRLSDTQQMGKSGILGCIKYLCGEAMTDANFHREQPFVMKAIKGASIPGVQIKLPGLGGYHAKISSGRIKEILDNYVADISSAAGWGGQGIVEGCALYIATILKDEATATAMINAFNSQFEGENIRVNIEDKLNENKNIDMLYTNFTDFLSESYINEALKSSKLRNLIDMRHSPKTLLKGIYGAFKIALDKIEDHQILDIDPKNGPKQTDSIVLYYTTQEKENPYASGQFVSGTIPANTLLALGRGKKVFYVRTDYKGRKRTYTLTSNSKAGRWGNAGVTNIGPNKEYRGWDASGLGSLARVINVADAAFAINPESLESTEDKIRNRAKAKEGALAFKSDKEFKAANMQRYNDILAKRASSLDIDKLVEDAIADMANIMKDAIKNKEKNKYGELIAGVGQDGRAYKMNDISNFTSNLLRDYERWAGYIADIEKAKEKYKDDAKEMQWEVKYAEKEAKEYAKAIKDRLAKLKKRNLAW